MDAFEETYWNLTQLLAWIYLGDRRLVRKAADGQNENGSFLQEAVLPDGRRELVAGSANPTNPIHLELTAAYKGGAHYLTLEDAENEAIAVLQQGRLSTIGLENGQGNPLEVPQIQWAELRFAWGPPRAVPKDVARAGASHWYSLKFVRSEVLEIWPDPLALPAGAESFESKPDRPTPRRGRPRTWKWDDFGKEVTRIANTPDGLPENQADLVRTMSSWCLDTWGAEPADSLIRERISETYRHIANHANKS